MAGKMIVALVSCLVSLAFLAQGEVSEDDHGSNALSYDADTFAAALEKNRNFVMFYAPWCGHCKNLAPTWDELAKLYNKAEDSPVVIAKVDCTVHTGLCADHEVVGFPTLKLFEAGGDNHKRYSGKRDLDSLKAFIQEHVQGTGSEEEAASEEEAETEPEVPEPKTSLITLTDDNFVEHIATGYFFIKFFAPWCGHCKKLAPTWDDLADTFSHNDKVSIAKIDCTQSTVICKQYEIRGYPTLLWFKDGEQVEKFQGPRTHENLKKFVSDRLQTGGGEEQHSHEEEKVPDREEEATGAVKELTDENFTSHLASNLVFVKFYAPWCGHCKRLAPTWEELAKDFANVPVSIAKVDCTQYKTVCDDNQVRGYPTLKLFRKGAHVKDYKGSRSLEDLHKFVKEELGAHDEL